MHCAWVGACQPLLRLLAIRAAQAGFSALLSACGLEDGHPTPFAPIFMKQMGTLLRVLAVYARGRRSSPTLATGL
ncbi:hypothetical protein EON67_07165 [archaeon]|nr:MAG: hypothetical protein EON67_07165 [archaeon]